MNIVAYVLIGALLVVIFLLVYLFLALRRACECLVLVTMQQLNKAATINQLINLVLKEVGLADDWLLGILIITACNPFKRLEQKNLIKEVGCEIYALT